MSTTYTLEVPATNQTINQLIVKIIEEAAGVETRLTLKPKARLQACFGELRNVQTHVQ